MNLSDAILVAASAVAHLAPYCKRVSVAGSIRRKKRTVKDVEIVCVPKETFVSKDLFGDGVKGRDPGFIEAVNYWPKVRGEPTGRYTQRRILDEDGDLAILLDLFMCREDNWGVIFAIRTGPAAYSRYWIAEQARRVGMRIQGGTLTKNGINVPVYEEKDLFKLLKSPYLEPEERPG